METKDRLKEIAAKQTLTKADKAFVREVCEKLGIEIAKTNCAECVRDAAVQAWKKLSADSFATLNVHYKLREGVDVLVNGERCNEATATDENIERWLAKGLPASYVETI